MRLPRYDARTEGKDRPMITHLSEAIRLGGNDEHRWTREQIADHIQRRELVREPVSVCVGTGCDCGDTVHAR